jgi:hypothetical protein
MWVSSQDRTPPATTGLDVRGGCHGVQPDHRRTVPDPDFTIFNYGGTADVIIDVMGSYGPLTTCTHTYNGDGGIYSGMLGAGKLTTDTINAVRC